MSARTLATIFRHAARAATWHAGEAFGRMLTAHALGLEPDVALVGPLAAEGLQYDPITTGQILGRKVRCERVVRELTAAEAPAPSAFLFDPGRLLERAVSA